MLPWLFLSCQEGVETNKIRNKAPTQINLVESSDKDNLENLIQKINVVKLKTDIKLIAVHKAVFFDHNYYVLDKKTSNLLVFDDSGDYLRKIGEQGKGPGEYIEISDFEIDRKNGHILILAPYDKALYKFTLKGEFIERIVYNFYVNGGFVITYFATYVFKHDYAAPSHNMLTRTDANGKVIGEGFPFPKGTPMKMIGSSGGLHKQGKSNYFTQATSSLIYEVQDSITPLYQFNFGTDTWKEEDKYNIDGFIKRTNKFQASYLNNLYCDTDEVLAFQFAKGKFLRKGFYFKETGKVLAVPFNLNDSFLYRILDLPIGIKNDKFISSLSYNFYETMMASEEAIEFKDSYPGLYKDFLINLASFKANDNPYLLIYEVKDHN